jgi:hypothetical protein
VAGELAAEGNLAEVVYDDPTGRALVLVRESLRYRPWPAYELSLFHELSHLAAGHPLRVKRARGNGTGSRFRALGAGRLARGEPSVLSGNEERGFEERGFEELKREVLEPEARKRAKWLVLAGTCPEAFEADKADRLT